MDYLSGMLYNHGFVLAVEKLAPISTEMARLMKDQAEIDRILARGAERARTIAAPILKRTYEIVGLVG